MQPTGNTALITGGASGIGLALARRFAAHGNRVIITGRDPQRLAAAAAALPGAHAARADMADRAALRQLAAAHPDVNVLINCAAIQRAYQIADGAAAEPLIDAEVATNLAGPLALTALLLPQLLRQPQAAVVNITSVLGLLPKQSAPVYSATKAGLHAFTAALRWQLEGSRVRVFEVIPPLVDTTMTAGRGADKIAPDEVAAAFWRAFIADQTDVVIGRARLLLGMRRWLPSLAARAMRHAP